jgi:hypothetical protein
MIYPEDDDRDALMLSKPDPSRGLMPINFRQEEFSKAFVHAIASIAGYSVTVVNVDIDSVDISIRSNSDHTEYASPALDAQLKCTWDYEVKEDEIIYDLKVENYNKLIKKCHIPRILIVVVVPKNLEISLTQKEDELILRHCAYWISLKNNPPTSNSSKIRLRIPKNNTFNAESLHKIMENIGNQLEII